MKLRPLFAFWVCALFLSSCFGGGGEKTEIAGGTGACNPSEAAIGATVVCTAPGMTEDCTLFFAKVPIEFILNVEDEAVSFTVPSMLPGEKDVYFQCGDSGVKSLGKFTVAGTTIAGSGDQVTPPPATTPAGGTAGTGGETILPGTGTGGMTGGETAPPPVDSDGDGVPDVTDACPGTPSGVQVGSTGCPPSGPMVPPAPPTPEVNLTVTRSTTSGALLNTVKVDYSVTGSVKNIYLAGNIFNRSFFEPWLIPESDEWCKKVGTGADTRWLATQANGQKFNEGPPPSSLYTQNLPYLEGTWCGDLTHNICKTSDHEDPADLRFFVDPAPWCQITPRNTSGDLILSGSFSTRSFARFGRACLVVVAQDDRETVVCKDYDPPEVDLSVSSAQLQSNKIHAVFSYANVWWKPVVPSGCVEVGSSTPTNSGTGNLTLDCDVSQNTTTITVVAQGIGLTNSISKSVILTRAAQSFTFDWNSSDKQPEMKDCDQNNLPEADCSGKVEFLWRASADYTITDDTGATLGSGKAPWIKAIRFYEGGDLIDTQDIASDVDYGTIEMRRNHSKDSWEARYQTIDGQWPDYDKGLYTKEWKYVARFVSGATDFNSSGSYDCMIDDCDSPILEGDCCDSRDCGACPSNTVSDCTNHKIHAEFLWGAYHIKSLESTCGGSFDHQPDSGAFNLQTGKWTKDYDGQTLDCTIKATTYDDQIIEQGPWHMHFDNNC